MVLASAVVFAGPAQAIVPTFVTDGITYEMVDRTATAIGFDGVATSVDIPAIVDAGNGREYPVTAIGDGAFSDYDLESVTIGDNVTAIGDAAFENNAIAELSLGLSVETIRADAFAGNALTELDFPASVRTIGDGAFRVNQLTSISFHEGIISIGPWAFQGNPLTAVVFPASVQGVAEGAFERTLLSSATFAGAPPMIVRGDDGPFASLGSAMGLTVHYLSQFGSTPGRYGFETPTWMGYNTVIDPIVSFDLGGYGTADPQRLISGSLAVAPDAPVREDWEIDGWYSDADFSTEFDFALAPTDDVTLFAHWVAVEEPVLPDASLSLDLGLAVGDVVAGAPVTVSGAGLQEGSDYTGILRSTPVLLVGGTIDASGAFSRTAAFPAGLTAGQHTVTLSGTAANGSPVSAVAYLTVSATGTVTYLSYTAAETVTADETVPAVTPAAALASTGFDGAPLGFAALLLLLAGAALVVRRRSVA
jgi:uncharacterized repeat protein (TIGR02543 family)